MLFQRLKVEFLVSFFLVYISGMAAIQLEKGKIDDLGYAFIHFLLYAILLWSSKEISGAQLNPIISLFNSIGPEETILHAFLYIIIQILSSIFAVCILRTSTNSQGRNHLNKQYFIVINYKITLLIYPKEFHDTFDRERNEDLKYEPSSSVITIISTFYLVIIYYTLVVQKNAPKYVYGAGVAAFFFITIYFSKNHAISEMNIAKFVAFSIVNFEFNG